VVQIHPPQPTLTPLNSTTILAITEFCANFVLTCRPFNVFSRASRHHHFRASQPELSLYDDEFWKKCRCRKHFRYTANGKQRRVTAKTRSWEQAERNKRQLEARLDVQLTVEPLAADEPKTVEYATAAFLKEKLGGKAAENTLGKYRLTLSRLQKFCDRNDLFLIRDLKLAHLSSWRSEWTRYYSSVWALRNEQSRVRAFFRYCHNAGMIADNPAAKMSTIKVRDEDYKVDPFTEREYTEILKTIPQCEDIIPLNRQRLSCLVQLQRWAGLSIIDGVCLSRDELKRQHSSYWVDTRRRKTGVHVCNPVPRVLGKQMENLENSNRQYFFISGEATMKSAAGLYDKLYRKVFERAGIKNGGSHRLRHLFAVSLLQNGVDMRTVSKALGHSSNAVTEKFYAGWDRKQQENLDKSLRKAWARKHRARG